ncbi:hypothetical protein PYW07_016700 [Mythimna separata]|uniref:Uncharacterized protein n=1 Tax=Mythimna separata TaxID=271217 RepID=A0AAD7YM46_MYTSE|nr:hypothetical protein PYW07_016700 [Mythimna separata]
MEEAYEMHLINKGSHDDQRKTFVDAIVTFIKSEVNTKLNSMLVEEKLVLILWICKAGYYRFCGRLIPLCYGEVVNEKSYLVNELLYIDSYNNMELCVYMYEYL